MQSPKQDQLLKWPREAEVESVGVPRSFLTSRAGTAQVAVVQDGPAPPA